MLTLSDHNCKSFADNSFMHSLFKLLDICKRSMMEFANGVCDVLADEKIKTIRIKLLHILAFQFQILYC